MDIGVVNSPKTIGIRYGIFNKYRIGTATTTYPNLGVKRTNKQYKISIITIIITDNIFETKYTCPIVIKAASNTNMEDGVKALSNDKAKTMGSFFKRSSYPIEVLISWNTIIATINFIIGSMYNSNF
jgi:hypothetical protein